jgi:APA family basic amino acid/polyamine antiporter
VPANSIILIGFLACIYSLSGEFDLLTDLGVFSCWVFYTLTFACVMHLRKTHPNWERTYRVPCYPVVPLLAIGSGLYVIASQLFLSGTRGLVMSLFSVIITLAGLPIYLAMKRKQQRG